MAMSTRSLAPGYIRGTYTGVLFPHHVTIPVNIVGTPTPGEMPSLRMKGGDTILADEGYADFLQFYRQQFNEVTLFGLAEVHTVDADTGEDQFIFAWDAGLTGGTTTQPRVATGQAVMTMKSNIGSLYRLYAMEGTADPGTKLLPTFPGTVLPELHAYLIQDNSIVYARKNAYLFSAVSYVTKLNDKLRKQQGLA